MSKIKNELKNDKLMPLRHSAQHVLAMSVEKIWPDTKKVMGPPIENGYYFDFDLEYKISPQDFKKIENQMQKIVEADLPIVGRTISVVEAKEIFSNNEYKLHWISEIEERGEEVGVYEIGTNGEEYYDIDLCAGPHVKSTGQIKAFKLQSVAGAYFKGDENNKMLQRIYGTAWDSADAQEKYLNALEEAKNRDHRKLGQELELFFLHETSPGSPYWLPNGLVVYNELINYWRSEHTKRGYQEIASPLINKKELWETSGHWEHYKDDMFIADMGENEIYGVKPMNCPNAMLVFKSRPRSYKELPLRLSDTDTLHRYEKSGTLHGLLRVRAFRQDDSHNFITEDMIKSEYKEIFEIANEFYGIFNMDFKYRLGTRPEKFLGDVNTWDKAEKALHEILTETVGENGYYVEEGDGAFYGPKVDIVMKDSLNREWQMGTIQLDFQLPQRFDLKYIDENGKERTPVVIHRVIYGSLERFIGILIEHFGGAFPLWLAPVQAEIIPISDKHIEYAKTVEQTLKETQIRVQMNIKDSSMGAKIRDAQLRKVPYMIILGDAEVAAQNISVRNREGESGNNVDVREFITLLSKLIENKSIEADLM